ncbi:hypothetical protein ACFPN0_32085 [Kitasatospora cinereorecta]
MTGPAPRSRPQSTLRLRVLLAAGLVTRSPGTHALGSDGALRTAGSARPRSVT